MVLNILYKKNCYKIFLSTFNFLIFRCNTTHFLSTLHGFVICKKIYILLVHKNNTNELLMKIATNNEMLSGI